MRISLIQYNIIWENKKANLDTLKPRLEKLSGLTDLAVLPEMFTTGFSMNSRQLAEPMDGTTVDTLKQWAAQFGFALAGSFICNDNGQYRNRAFFITPEGDVHTYDKRHLFRMGEEPNHFKAGNQPGLLTYRGWKIRLAICYDLRFPVWLRNANNTYDLLLVVANWPTARIEVWDTLLVARALENQCYVCAVNRTGEDGAKLPHAGHSALIDARGKHLIRTNENKEDIQTLDISRESLQRFREKFPVWKDADNFVLTS